ncbi:aminoglycoside phosphotransferase family protein [Micromonospora sp. WMMD1120]|uniref:aminoglycoside phosphotransferase family protein n=1 Tax=Micromonospora sp. WMMD1120 TaxID=3016106 RepID=UPI002417A22F|nr:aminoglycoside phosphotransferase family protein [Micromonospora sp. WMMD1120]MDG4806798.1 aminoglycoside phosphotransferase family protein [Micromonospora sp. WMMD1120]
MTTIAGERTFDWSSEQWQVRARSWVDAQVSQAGRRVVGQVESRVRPWSLVWRVPTDDGPVWFKANNPGTTHEAVLIATLAEVAPDRVLTPIAVDPAQGWSLLPDGGESLRDVLGRDSDLTHWERALPGYAALQLASARRADELVARGVPDHRPEVLAGLLVELLDDRRSLLIGAEGGLSPEVYERLRAAAPSYAERCRRLADLGIPATVQHDDLHDGNVFAGVYGYRYFDWGDASVAHPFGTLLVTLRAIRHDRRLAADDARLARLRDAYLEAWTDRYDRRTLVAAADLAISLGPVSRSLSWRRALDTADPARGEFVDAVPGWLAELLGSEPA